MKNNGLIAGLAGAVALTAAHQLLHRVYDKAPRMDLMGVEALTKASHEAGMEIPEKHKYSIAMAADIVSNALFYSIIAAGKPKHALLRGGLLGMAAGIGGVVLPKHIGLTNAFSDRTTETKVLTVSLYTLGGLVTGAVVRSKM